MEIKIKDNKEPNSKSKSDKKYLIASLVLFLILILSILFIFLIYPLIKPNNNVPIERTHRIVTTSEITSSTHLESDNRLILTYNEDESVIFSSSSDSVFLGPYSSSKYIYGAKDSNPNIIDITYSNPNSKDIEFTVTVSDNNGNNQKVLAKEEYSQTDNKVTISSIEAIYIYKVDIAYLTK